MQGKRRETRKTHLDASVVPVERSLIARANCLTAEAWIAAGDPGADDYLVAYESLPIPAKVKLGMADEFRALAEELHWW